MKKINKLLLGLFMAAVVTTPVCFAAYKMSNKPLDNYLPSVESETDPNKQICKVTYKYNGKSEISYVKKGTKLDYEDFPTYMGNNGSTLSWKNEQSNVTYNPMAEGQNKIIVNQDCIISATEVPKKSEADQKNSIVSTNGAGGNISQPKRTNDVSIVEPENSDKTKVTNEVKLGGNYDGMDLQVHYFEPNTGALGNKNKIENNLGYATVGLVGEFLNKATTDESIALEDPSLTADSIYSSEYRLFNKEYFYKPDKNGNVRPSENRCVNRLVLSCDTIIKNGVFDLGAKTGFYGLHNWAQRNFQGFIIGGYTELDLNGHNLIIGAGGTLNSYGSITNSRPSEGGKVIVENGGTLLSSIVFETQEHERSFPVGLGHGAESFDSIRMPYLDCNTVFKYGSHLKGKFRVNFGGNNANFVDETFTIIGKDSGDNAIIKLCNPEAYLERNVSYDLKGKAADNSVFLKSNLLHQVISYEAHNCKEIILDRFVINIKILNVTFDMDTSKSGYFIPMYFQIKLFNSTLRTYHNLTFMPGSSLYVDKDSKVILDSTGVKTFSSNSTENLPNHGYQGIGGLNFIMEKGRFNDAASNQNGWVADCFDNKSAGDPDREGYGRGGGGQLIFRTPDNFWRYLNTQRFAHADIDGTIEIAGANVSNNPHQLGGIINIKNVALFKQNMAARNDVTLYANGGKIGPCSGWGGLTNMLKNHKVFATDFFNYPLISNGNVLMDMNNKGKVRENYATFTQTYSKSTGLITSGSKKYAFIHTNKDGTAFSDDIFHARRSAYSSNDIVGAFNNGLDSYYGRYFEVKEASNSGGFVEHTIIVNLDHGKQAVTGNSYAYAFFRGAFLPFTSINGVNEIHIDKLVHTSGGRTVQNLPNNRKATWQAHSYYNNEYRWRIN